MGREYELKYRADHGHITEIREKFGDFESISMETSYYDTLDRSFHARRWTLRRRLENGRSVCGLKTPLPDGSRGEWETAADTIEAAIPELCRLGAPAELSALAAEGLTIHCGAVFTRLARTLTMNGFAVELALDEGVLLGGGQALPFAEVEVELKSGSEIAAVAFAQNLAAEFRLAPEHKSKVQRARDLADR